MNDSVLSHDKMMGRGDISEAIQDKRGLAHAMVDDLNKDINMHSARDIICKALTGIINTLFIYISTYNAL